MPYRNHDQKLSIQMISVLVVLGIVLLVIPVVCALFVLFSKLKRDKRAEIIKNATSTRTTVTKGSNGRTVFETTAIKSSPPRAAPLSPVLPFTQQQASRASRPMSMKNTWKRLSRPFSAAHMAYEDDEIELTQPQKQRPAPHSSRFKENLSTGHDGSVSPLSPLGQSRRASSSSWNTVDRLDSSPISPVSMTGLPASSSREFQQYQYNQNQKSRAEDYTNSYRTGPTSTLPSTAHTDSRHDSKKTKAGIDLGSARGFVTATIKEQVLTDTNQAKAKQAAMGLAEAAGRHAAASIKKSVLDNKHKANTVQLSAPPKAKLAGTRR